ncbi:MAG: LysM peptidoglycan-binding domain-containing protein [Candidatus Levybacteria bacterium]|nr:LysM peptidoglycan-binding domain-containing protein [Candidatus Levybacteria bacterium]
MAKVGRKKLVTLKKFKKTHTTGIFSGLKLPESYTSLILGAIVVLIVAILFVIFAKGQRIIQTSSTSEEQTMEQESDGKTSSSYTVKTGDDLWSISENVYSDGYKWVEIAKANKLENPGIIEVGNKLIIPKIEKKKVAAPPITPTQASTQVMENNSINGTSYTIKEGDNLWDICVKAYGDGFKWPEIAKANNLENPNLIYPDNVLKLPR